MLGTIVQNSLGSALGFRGGGIISWIIRMVAMRYGRSLIRRIFGRILLGR